MSRMRVILFLGVPLLAGLSACGSAAPPSDIRGVWGGDHIALVGSETGATVEYDCAHGTVDEALVPDKNGRIDVLGTHTREHGGPDREGEMPDVHPARYQGYVSQGTLTVTVTLTDTGDVLGPFTLVRGDSGNLFKCL
jgi:hypothetical protein